MGDSPFLCMTMNDPDTPLLRDTKVQRNRKTQVSDQALYAIERIIELAVRLQPEARRREFSILTVLLSGQSVRAAAKTFGTAPEEVLACAESAAGHLQELARHLSDSADSRESYRRAIHGLKERYEKQLADERDERRKAFKEKRQMQDDIIGIITDSGKRKKFLRQIPVHQMPVSSMLQSLLLNAGYDTLGNVIDRMPQQLSRNTATNQIYIAELRKFIADVGM